jgi:hypothetical protein
VFDKNISTAPRAARWRITPIYELCRSPDRILLFGCDSRDLWID